MNPGSIVRCRNRDWVLLPGTDDTVYLLRSLTGTGDQVVAIHKELSKQIGYSIPEERIQPSQFPLPSADDVSDSASAHLLWQAARLSLREGAAPLRSPGKISIRPRVYQFVPLLMALRLNPIRLFIADDVGVGKTIEALLIARELIDRGEVQRMSVLCPPYLCEQWEKELKEKFNLDAVVFRSGTINQLEKQVPPGKSIYQHYPIQVISIDWVKSERNKYHFLQFCPELVIVDEVHGSAEAGPQNKNQQQRHNLLKEIAKNQQRHLILLTATPHSGVEKAFQSLLALLKPEFAEWEVSALDESRRAELAKHFVQRTRRDILHNWEGEHCFPDRESSDVTYNLSDDYLNLFIKTYRFSSELIRSGEHLEKHKQRVRYWGALALLRCVMSSPAEAIVTLEARMNRLAMNENEEDFHSFVFESTDLKTDDDSPVPPIEAMRKTLAESEKRKLQELTRLARNIFHSENDNKLKKCVKITENLLSENYHPIIWCRYVATAEYVGEKLRAILPSDVQVVVITGRIGDEQRRIMIDEISTDRPRVLVATDCLSEGINLQEKFTAVIHYDLPWNPNRLEQREGRIDRYGQTASKVKAIRFYGRNNPVDGVLIDVLLNKANEIHRTLGTYVPVPQESESVTEAVLNALFLRKPQSRVGQLVLDFGVPEVIQLHRRWEQEAERERINRTRFAQRALKPEEVKRELEATDAVLGDPGAVKEFVLTAMQKLGIQILRNQRNPDIFHVPLSPQVLYGLPEVLRFVLPGSDRKFWKISFISPTPEGAEYLGRNHPFVATLARFLLEEALEKHGQATASRCGVIRTNAVQWLTTLLLLRIRYLVEIPNSNPLLSEEVMILGYDRLENGIPRWVHDEFALELLSGAQSVSHIPIEEKKELIQDALNSWPEIQPAITHRIHQRARELEHRHKRIRQAVSLRIRELKVIPQFPADLLGILILQPRV